MRHWAGSFVYLNMIENKRLAEGRHDSGKFTELRDPLLCLFNDREQLRSRWREAFGLERSRPPKPRTADINDRAT